MMKLPVSFILTLMCVHTLAAGAHDGGMETPGPPAAQHAACEVLDAARAAARQALRAGVESNAVAVATALHHVARALMKLCRWYDAETVLRAVHDLADNPCIEADLEWCRAMRAYESGNIDALTNHALKCVRLVPDLSWEPYHYAAVGLYALKHDRQAAALWLEGLAAFVNALPLEELEDYLDAALCYWKIFEADEIVQWYDTLQAIVEAHGPSELHQHAFVRALQERIKLAVFCEDLLAQRRTAPRLRTCAGLPWEKSPAGDWCVSSNPVMRVPVGLLIDDPHEKAINNALVSEYDHDMARAARFYQAVLLSGTCAQVSAARIQGATPLLFAQARYARLSPHTITGGAHADREALAQCHAALRLAITNILSAESALADEELFQLLLVTAEREWCVGSGADARALYEWAFSVLPTATATRYLSRLLAAEPETAGGVEQLYHQLLTLNEMPLLRPPYRLRERQYALLCTAALQQGTTTTSVVPLLIACAFDVLERSVMDMAAHPADPCFCADPFLTPPFAALTRAHNAGVLSQQHCERMYELVRRLSVVIPATQRRMRTLLHAREQVDAFAALRNTRGCSVLVLCDARAWPAADAVWLLTDASHTAMAWRRVTSCNEYPALFLDDVTGMWVGHLNLPPGIVTVRYKTAPTREALLQRRTDVWDGGFFIAGTNENVARICVTSQEQQ